MPLHVSRSVAVQVLLFCTATTYLFCTNLDDSSVKSLLQKGIDRGYPGHRCADPVGGRQDSVRGSRIL